MLNGSCAVGQTLTVSRYQLSDLVIQTRIVSYIKLAFLLVATNNIVDVLEFDHLILIILYYCNWH